MQRVLNVYKVTPRTNAKAQYSVTQCNARQCMCYTTQTNVTLLWFLFAYVIIIKISTCYGFVDLRVGVKEYCVQCFFPDKTFEPDWSTSGPKQGCVRTLTGSHTDQNMFCQENFT